MFDLSRHDGPDPKCFFTSSSLPAFVNHEQIPSKKRPFPTISEQAFSHTVDLILPQANATALQQALTGGEGQITYAKVFMKPIDLVTGDFFNKYIKTGNIIMLSQGRPGIDRTFTLVEGMLRTEVDKATFERMGLEGKAVRTEGRKHVKARYVIELNLRLPSMVHGKKGFERILWAFKNVLDQSVTWLFYDLNGSTDETVPIAEHQPIIRTARPEVTSLGQATVPHFPQDISEKDYDVVAELLEWLTLATMESPRLQQSDDMDSYLSRYQVPTRSENSADGGVQVQDVAHFHWHGLLPAQRVREIYLTGLKTLGDNWFAINATAFDGKTYTILQDKQHTMTWEYVD